MDAETFQLFWTTNYSTTLPIGHELKWNYQERWFRIHSLPESKRYAQSEEEYQVIFKRQNKLITNLIGDGIETILLFGLYTNSITNNNYSKVNGIVGFKKSYSINLKEIEPEEYEEETFYEIFIKVINWKSNKYNAVLKAIADDEIKMMFICPSKNRIIYPYDGGVDIIMENECQRNSMKKEYNKWLSKYPEGL